MALLEYILSKSMQGATVPPDSPVQEVSGVQAESVAEAPATESTPIAAATSFQDTPTEQADTSVPVEAPVNKWGYSDSDLAALSRNRYTPEELDYYNIGDYDPDKHGSYIKHIYEGTKTKPAELDEKKIRNAKMISGITDAVGLIGQMISVGKGAHARERDYESSALGRTEAKEKELRNIYKQELDKYESGLADAEVKDYLRGLDDFNARRKGIGDIVDANRKFEEGVRQVNAKMQFDYAKLAQDQENKNRDYELKKQIAEDTKKYRADISARGWTNIQLRTPGGGKDAYQMVISANPKDAQAQDDQLGGRVRVLRMTQGDVDRLFSEALKSKEFKAKFPEYDRKPGLMGEAPKSFTAQEKVDIANVYAKELYDLQWKDSAGAQASPQSYSWSQSQWGEWIP